MPSLRDFKFKDFSEAFGFMTRWRCWRRRPTTIRNGRTSTTRCRSRSSTHDAGGVTGKDVALADGDRQAAHLKLRPCGIAARACRARRFLLLAARGSS